MSIYACILWFCLDVFLPRSFVFLDWVDFWDFGPNRLESFAFLQGSPVPLAEQPSEVFLCFSLPMGDWLLFLVPRGLESRCLVAYGSR